MPGITSIEERFPRPSVVGVVNVTPDSFSDGGETFDQRIAIARGLEQVAAGAAIVDVGGESTRPGAEPVEPEEELRRVLAVVEELARLGVAISIDTRSSRVAQAAVSAGALVVNDVSALRHDPHMAGVVADAGAGLCLVHMLGDDPRTMQDDPHYDDVVDDVASFLERRLEEAIDAGVREERICLDPGIGFGKTVEHNLQLLRGLPRLARIGRPLLVGVSRKAFLMRLTHPGPARDRLAASLAATVEAYRAGATLLRVHDVAETVDALAIVRALEDG
ncbi:MAG: dihydropteroate synthase [Gaiellales bacterium]